MSGWRDRFEKEINRVGVSHIAQTLGVARNTVYNWMANGNAPLNQLLALEGLGIDIVYVLTGKPGTPMGASAQVNQDLRPYGLSVDENTLVEGYRHSVPEIQAAALRLLTAPPKPEPTMPKSAKLYSGERTGKQPKVEDRIQIRNSDRPTKKFTPPKKRGGEE